MPDRLIRLLHGTTPFLRSSGLQASEAAALRVGDWLLAYGQSSLLVRQGKGGRDREVFIPEALSSAT